jgi:hypothetical protein
VIRKLTVIIFTIIALYACKVTKLDICIKHLPPNRLCWGPAGHKHNVPPYYKLIRQSIFNIKSQTPFFSQNIKKGFVYITVNICMANNQFSHKDLKMIIEKNGFEVLNIDLAKYKYELIFFNCPETSDYKIQIVNKTNKQGCVVVEVMEKIENE